MADSTQTTVTVETPEAVHGRVHGTQEEGTWVIGSRYENDWGWGPLPTRTEAIAFIEPRDHMFAVNLREHPRFFNLAP